MPQEEIIPAGIRPEPHPLEHGDGGGKGANLGLKHLPRHGDVTEAALLRIRARHTP